MHRSPSLVQGPVPISVERISSVVGLPQADLYNFLQGRESGRGSSLHRRYPASSLLRPPPTPAQARSRLWIPLISRGRFLQIHRRRSRSPRFLTDLSTPAVPYHPGEPDRCHCSLLHGRFQASPLLEGWPLPLAYRGRNGFTRARYG